MKSDKLIRILELNNLFTIADNNDIDELKTMIESGESINSLVDFIWINSTNEISRHNIKRLLEYHGFTINYEEIND